MDQLFDFLSATDLVLEDFGGAISLERAQDVGAGSTTVAQASLLPASSPVAVDDFIDFSSFQNTPADLSSQPISSI